MPIELWLNFLFVLMIIGSIVALELKDVLSSIIAIGVVGLGVSISFLLLQAPDLAIVQFLFEIFCVVILIQAFIHKSHHQMESSRSNRWLTAATILTAILLFIGCLPLFKVLPPFGKPLMSTAQYYLDHGAEQTGAANLVSSIVLDYRGYDTFGEVTILFTAILGTFTILRKTAKAKHHGGQHE
ncbi:MAG: DUF4040 domain-containing protein [Calditrichaeota bacterium]|nr:MAG: DUF4040 domain-containing protein [Calditrichota bacterium]